MSTCQAQATMLDKGGGIIYIEYGGGLTSFQQAVRLLLKTQC